MKAKRNKSYYKSTDAWITAVYRNNKEFIDSAIEGIGAQTGVSNLTIFKRHMKEYMDEGYKPMKALKEITKEYTPIQERRLSGILNSIKQDKELFDEFRRKTGWNKKIDINKFTYDSYHKTYSYDGLATIVFHRAVSSTEVGYISIT